MGVCIHINNRCMAMAALLQERVFDGGSQQLSIGLAKRLTDAGVRLLLNTACERVVHGSEGGSSGLPDGAAVHVVCSNGVTLRARRVIVAVPPQRHDGLAFEPRLPYLREQLLSRTFVGCMIKAVVVYAQDFWRRQGYSGEAVCDATHGPVFNMMDDTFTRGDGTVQPALVVFMNGAVGWQWGMKDAATRRQAFVVLRRGAIVHARALALVFVHTHPHNIALCTRVKHRQPALIPACLPPPPHTHTHPPPLCSKLVIVVCVGAGKRC